MEDLSRLITESRNSHSEHIDELSTLEMLTRHQPGGRDCASRSRVPTPAIAQAVDAIAERFAAGRTPVLHRRRNQRPPGCLDASECPPTFSVPPALVQGLIAGGDAALRNSSEHSEDSPRKARAT